MKKANIYRVSYFIWAFVILLTCLLASVRLFGHWLYNYPVNPPLKEIPRDAVLVCLAGGRGRVLAAFELFSQGIGSELFIVGAGPKTNVQTVLKNILATTDPLLIPNERINKISLEKESRNTVENAYAVENFLRQHPQVHQIVLITSNYHMRRSLLVMQNLLQKNIQIIPYSPTREVIERGNWWYTWLGIEVTVVEYGKFLLAKILVPNLRYF